MRKIIKIILFSFIITSCNAPKEHTVDNNFVIPFKTLIKSNDLGNLLEFALYDTTNINKVKEIICDSLNNIHDIYFIRIEKIYEQDTLFFLQAYPHDGSISCADGTLLFYINLDSPEIIRWMGDDYTFSNLNSLIDSISILKNTDKTTLIGKNKLQNFVIPRFAFVIKSKSFSCEYQFIEKIVSINSQIETQLAKVSNELYSDTIKIRPKIEIDIIK